MTFHIFKIMLIPKRIIWIFIFIHLHVIIFILFPFISLLLLIVKTASQVAQQQRTHRLSRRCRRHRFDPWVGKIPWRRKWQPTPVFLPEKSHGHRNLAGYVPWSQKSQTQLSNETTSMKQLKLSLTAFFLLQRTEAQSIQRIKIC